MKNVLYPCLFSICLVLLAACHSQSSFEVYDLQCEKLVNPLAIDNTSPHLGWKISSKKPGMKPIGYQVLAASAEKLLSPGQADLWDSGKVDSEESIWVPYQGNNLKSKSFVYWKVRIWDETGEVSDWSVPASFGVGLLHPEDWTAEFIGGATTSPSSPMLRKSFQWDGNGQKALLHVNSLGYHEIYLNGEKVGDYVLTPAVSQFNKRSLILTYDMTSLLKKGTNDLVLWLGKGWYQNGLPGVVAGGPYVRAQLECLQDGAWTNILQTDNTWQTRESGYSTRALYRFDNFGKEVIDGAKLLPDMTTASLESASWQNARRADIPEHQATPQMAEPNKIQGVFHPVSVTSIGDSVWMVDMGKNFVGWTEIRFPQLESQQKVLITYCDFLDENGKFRNNGSYDTYIASGKGNEAFRNKFDYCAYRYIKLENLSEAPELSAIDAYPVRTDYSGTSSFSCSDKDMNAIHDMIHYTFTCLTQNGYMVDCPHLERLGYGGDGNASALTAQTMYNLAPLYANWMQAWGDCMREDGSMPHTAPNPYPAGGGPYWCGFIITASWQAYVNYGDTRLIERYYPYMEQWLKYVDAYTKDGLLTPWPDTDYRAWYLGDWATPTGINQQDPQSIGVVTNCYISICYDTMVKIAGILGKKADQEKYGAKGKALKQLIHQTYYKPEEKSYSTDTQIDLIYPMLVGATPDELLLDVLATVRKQTEGRFNGHLATGLVGIPVITEWAVRNREADFMYNMLKKRDYPGYLYMLDHGATATWEHWNGDRSQIHNCYNGIGSWFYEALAGIVPDEQNPGFRHVFIAPQLVKGISWVKAAKDTPFGPLKVEWKLEEGAFIMNADIPVGSKATISVPVKANEVTINGQKCDQPDRIEVIGGQYEIKAI